MSYHYIRIGLEDSVLRRLSDEASRRGCTRGELIRQLVSEGLEEESLEVGGDTNPVDLWASKYPDMAVELEGMFVVVTAQGELVAHAPDSESLVTWMKDHEDPELYICKWTGS